MAKIEWIQYTERATGMNHPSRPDVVNRPLRQLLQFSGISPDEDGIALLTNASMIDWAQISDTPTTLAGYTISDAYTIVEINSLLATKSDVGHTHPISDIEATGTPSATTFLRGDGSWAAPAGGGGSASFFNPYAVDPLTANAKSDGFDGGSLNAKWTPSGVAGEVITISSSVLRLKTTGTLAASIAQPAPVGSFKIRAPVCVDPITTNFQQGAIFFQATSGKVVHFVLAHSTSNIIQAQRLTNMDTFSAAIGASLTLGALDTIDWLWLQIEYDGTNLLFSYSKNGLVFVQLASETLAAFLVDIAKIGVRVSRGGSAVTTTFLLDCFIVE